MYLYIPISIYVFITIYLYISKYLCISKYLYIYISIYIYLNIYISIFIDGYIDRDSFLSPFKNLFFKNNWENHLFKLFPALFATEFPTLGTPAWFFSLLSAMEKQVN